ncbi:MAG: pseudouridine synthase, partial [Clostridia bacterium]
MAESGVGSRRFCDKLIQEGKVFVNGRRIGLGVDVDPITDKIAVDGKQVFKKENDLYYMLNKPKGYVCTVSDDLGRRTVMDLMPKDKGRLYPIGRLDYDTEGMLIFTNDGELCDRLTHPRNEISKTYSVRVDGLINETALAKLKGGVEIEPNVVVRAIAVHIVSANKEESKIEMTIMEGKNRQVRNMLAAVDKEVTFLKRIK